MYHVLPNGAIEITGYREGAGFATGQKFPDALTSSFLLGSGGSVLGLVSPSDTSSDMFNAVKTLASSSKPTLMRVFGDVNSVPTAVRIQLVNAAAWSSYNTKSK